MLVKVDEDLPKAVTRILQEKGHEAFSAQEQGMGGWKDEALWRAVQGLSVYPVSAITQVWVVVGRLWRPIQRLSKVRKTPGVLTVH